MISRRSRRSPAHHRGSHPRQPGPLLRPSTRYLFHPYLVTCISSPVSRHLLRRRMPFYRISEMQAKRSGAGPAMGKSVAGELLKVGITTYQEGEGPPPHFHPNEEQFILVLEGKMRRVLGEEERIIEPGYRVDIPRNVRHGVCAIG